MACHNSVFLNLFLSLRKKQRTNVEHITFCINSANCVVIASSECRFFDFNAVSSSVSCKNLATSNFAFNCFRNFSC